MRKLNIVQQTSEVIRHSFGPTLAFISLMSMATFAPQPVALAQNDPSWITTGSLNIARSNYTATLLADRRVLVVADTPTSITASLVALRYTTLPREHGAAPAA